MDARKRKWRKIREIGECQIEANGQERRGSTDSGVSAEDDVMRPGRVTSSRPKERLTISSLGESTSAKLVRDNDLLRTSGKQGGQKGGDGFGDDREPIQMNIQNRNRLITGMTGMTGRRMVRFLKATVK